MENDLQVLLKTNTLIKAKYDLTALENRILNKVLFEIQRHPDTLIAKVSVDELKNMTKNNRLHSISELELILKRLANNEISQVNNKGWVHTPILAGREYNESTNTFDIGLSPIFLRLLNSYKEQGFSSVDLTKYATLDIPASQRLYELLRVYTVNKHNKKDDKGRVNATYKILELREYLHLIDNYPRMYDFKRFVIDAATKEINKKKLMNIVEVQYNKIGRKVDSVTFLVEDLEPATYNFKKIDVDKKDYKVDEDNYNYDENDNSDLSVLAIKVNLSMKTMEKLYKEHGYAELKICCDILLNSKGITARLKYLKGILAKRKEQGKSIRYQQLGLNAGVDMTDESGIIGWDE